VRGTTATNDELTGNFGSAPEDTSISDYRFVALFAAKSLKAIFRVLQHNRTHNGLKFAKFKHLLRKVAARSSETICVTIGEILRAFTPTECATGYAQS
jgi:hypothetical protein